MQQAVIGSLTDDLNGSCSIVSIMNAEFSEKEARHSNFGLL